MTSYQPLKTVNRTLGVLTAMNRQQVSTIAQLNVVTKLPKPTLVRVLETLVTAGYVSKNSKQAGYCLTSKVLSLSAGYHGGSKLIEISAGVLRRLTEKHRWPTALATLDVDAMIVRYSTIPETPFAHVQSTLDKRLPLTSRAHGRAYLAFCPAPERKVLLHMISSRPTNEDTFALGRENAERIIEMTRRHGYAARDPKFDPQTATIAVPIKGDRRVLGTVGFTFYRRAVSQKEIVELLAPSLIAGAKEISHAFSLSGSQPS